MQLTISSDEPLDKVLAVVSAFYGVEVTEKKKDASPLEEVDPGITRPRPT